MSSIGPGIITIIVSIIGLAMVAVIVSQQAQTSNVIQAGGNALKSIIGAAVQPVSGNSLGFGSIGANNYSTTLGQMLGTG
jgi:lysophospholipase L1-like esterase